jgi:hypothetical protein
MPDIHPEFPPVKRSVTAPDNPPSDFMWGSDEIGEVINRTGRQAYHLLTNGRIRCARKIGGQWVASRSALLCEFGWMSE